DLSADIWGPIRAVSPGCRGREPRLGCSACHFPIGRRTLMSRGQTASKQKPTASRPGSARPSSARKKTEEKGMASKAAAAAATKAKVKEQEAPAEKETTPETPDSPLPLLDLSDAAVKKMI